MAVHSTTLSLAAVLLLAAAGCTSAASSTRKVLQDIDGAVCGLGAFFDTNTRQCRLCPVGRYGDEQDFTTTCKTCSTAYTTCCPGSTDSSQCIPTAQVGSRCTAPCRRGSGSNGVRTNSENYPCPAGRTKPLITDPYTNTPNTVAPYCSICPKNTYSAGGLEGSCLPCPRGTASCCPGTTQLSDCKREFLLAPNCPALASCPQSRPICPPGMAWDESERTCHPCGFGTYSDDPQATTCNECNTGYTTCCEGSRFSGQCVPIADVNAGRVCNYECPVLFGPFRKSK